MELPILNEIAKGKAQLVEFKGYNHNLYAGDGEFWDMKNMTGDYYPVLSTRGKRGIVKHLSKPNGLFAKEKLAWVDGTEFYYGGIKVGTVEDSPKQFASMGAYLVIFPDKKIYNTYDNTFESLIKEKREIVTVVDNTITCTTTPEEFTAGDRLEIACGTNQGKYLLVAIEEKKLMFMDENTGADAKFSSFTGTGSIKTIVPDMDYITESENRLWGCSSQNHEIYACKLGDPKSWNAYEGISTDSYAATVGSDGDFTGAVTHLGYILFFKENCVHAIYGSKPANYQITNTTLRGVEKGSEKSLVIVNETLYYKSWHDVCMYQGSTPSSVSYALGKTKYRNAAAGAAGNKYYISMQNETGWTMFVFDESSGLWHKEDNTHASYFANLNGNLYYIDAEDNNIKCMNINSDMQMNEEETLEWMAEFTKFDESSMEHKYIGKFQFRAELEENASLEVWLDYDRKNQWEKICSLTSPINKPFTIPIMPQRCDILKLRFKGQGICRIFALAKTVEGGSEL
jgi:hypothetical protein